MPQSPENSFGQATQSESFCLSALGVLVASGLMASQWRQTAAAAMNGSSGDGRQPWLTAVGGGKTGSERRLQQWQDGSSRAINDDGGGDDDYSSSDDGGQQWRRRLEFSR